MKAPVYAIKCISHRPLIGHIGDAQIDCFRQVFVLSSGHIVQHPDGMSVCN
jgi:hypothetical protein